MESPSSINTRQQERQTFTNQHDTITCDTICIGDGQLLPHWTLNFLSTNYCLTRFTCIFFLLLEYICFSINFFVFPGSFFYQHHKIYIYKYIYKGPFSIAPTWRCKRRHYSFPWIVQLILDPHRLILKPHSLILNAEY